VSTNEFGGHVPCVRAPSPPWLRSLHQHPIQPNRRACGLKGPGQPACPNPPPARAHIPRRRTRAPTGPNCPHAHKAKQSKNNAASRVPSRAGATRWHARGSSASSCSCSRARPGLHAALRAGARTPLHLGFKSFFGCVERKKDDDKGHSALTSRIYQICI